MKENNRNPTRRLDYSTVFRDQPWQDRYFKIQNWQKRPDGVQTLHSIGAAKTLGNKIFPYLLHKCKNWSQRYPSSCPTSGRMLPLGHSRAGSKQPKWVKFIRNLVYRLNPGSLPSCHCKRLLAMAQCLGDPAWLNSPLGMQIPTPIHWRLLEDNITQSLSSVACPESIAMRSGKQSLLLVNFPWAGAHRNITVICNKENIIFYIINVLPS